MSNYRQMKRALDDYIRAGVPLVLIRTIERHRVEQALRELAAERSLNAYCYTDAKQVQHFGAAGVSGTAGAAAYGSGPSDAAATPSKDVDSDPMAFIRERFRHGHHVIFALADTRRLGQDGMYVRELLAAAYLARDTGNTLIVVAAEDVWPRLSRFGLFVDLDFPDFGERRDLIVDFARRFADDDGSGAGTDAGSAVASRAAGPVVRWSDRDVDQLATLLRGMSEIQIVNLLRSSLVASNGLGHDDIPRLASSKEHLFTPVSNVTAVSYPQQLKVAGLNNLKAWLDRKRDVFFAPSDVLDEYCLQPPRGILLAGVPGCGKSFSAKMIAARWELPLFRFDIGAVYNKYVGETERRMQEALDYIDNVAPCVLWVDEIEKALSTTSGESDVANRVLGQFLFWLQESRAKVFMVATANDITHLPPELFRKGRFSETFFIDLPNADERAEAIRLYSRLCLHTEFSDDEITRLVDRCEGFSYSDIEQTIKDLAEQIVFGDGREDADDRPEIHPTAEALDDHFAHTIPIAPDRIAFIREWGRTHAQPAS
ncbi:AAA family ATPase [Bifidobacterium callimiconis]|uniref:AAA family ATPase n=1 Tax=Bifidobacterium callimiconis TaxID=2306973 RepID=UPI001BDC02A2|nr:AAA family ATPase [Bifidobacterium callimiconis]MBT1177628.1 AAA family ATPase [Bifidobacterium callimiconis]